MSGRLVHWGTRVHDDFMLPHFVEQDFRGALEELGALGFGLDPDWFAPHWRSASRMSGRWISPGSNWNCETRWSRGMCWARNRRSAAPSGTSTVRWSGCRPGLGLGG